MKLRTGFVSNSSSSSFCLMGLAIDDKAFSVQKAYNNKVNYEPGISAYWGQICIGLCEFDMEDQETLLEFKHRALKMCRVFRPSADISNIGWMEDAGFDG